MLDREVLFQSFIKGFPYFSSIPGAPGFGHLQMFTAETGKVKKGMVWTLSPKKGHGWSKER
jgi:hypothetical protein